MALSKEQSIAVRDDVKKLQPDTNPEHRKRYEDYRFYVLTINEGARNRAYDDATGKEIAPGKAPTGKVTVGIGFNMDRQGAREEWNAAFNNQAPDFDQVRSGALALSDPQVRRLFDHSIARREEELQRIYAGNWQKLQPNERLAIESMYYLGPKLVGSKTRFCAAVKNYCETGNAAELDKAYTEVVDHSNPRREKGVQNRRNADAALLDTHGKHDAKPPKQVAHNAAERMSSALAQYHANNADFVGTLGFTPAVNDNNSRGRA